jgi:hypothetical protein
MTSGGEGGGGRGEGEWTQLRASYRAVDRLSTFLYLGQLSALYLKRGGLSGLQAYFAGTYMLHAKKLCTVISIRSLLAARSITVHFVADKNKKDLLYFFLAFKTEFGKFGWQCFRRPLLFIIGKLFSKTGLLIHWKILKSRLFMIYSAIRSVIQMDHLFSTPPPPSPPTGQIKGLVSFALK